ncbi:MAG: twin-arginine translocase TatA/TatE family subunit [Bacillota bacterium]
MLHSMFMTATGTPLFLGWGMPGGAEWILIAAFGLLIFGKRLPEVGRSLGKGIVEFKKGLKGVEDEVEEASNRPTPAAQISQAAPATLPPGAKFDPYTGKPVGESSSPSSDANKNNA